MRRAAHQGHVLDVALGQHERALGGRQPGEEEVAAQLLDALAQHRHVVEVDGVALRVILQLAPTASAASAARRPRR